MRFIYIERHALHAPQHALYQEGTERYHECPERAFAIRDELLATGFKTEAPDEDPELFISIMHSYPMIRFLKDNKEERIVLREDRPDIILEPSYSVSITPGTYDAACSAVSCALSGAKHITKGERIAYALCRPPGHHASRTRMGGFCFFNNAAAAALSLAGHGRVAVLDIDLHHGNGTQDILYDRGILFISIHAKNVYPHTYRQMSCARQSSQIVTGNIVNFEAGPDTTDGKYLELTGKALGTIKSNCTDALVVSAGFDTSENDPIAASAFRLKRETYYEMGKKLHSTGLPALVVQEGGYNTESLGKDAAAFLKGLSNNFTSK